ncbi:MAG: Flp family type IVb pilin [Dehalococcoidia bacterium]
MSAIEQKILESISAVYGFVHNEKGQGMAEYGLILALVAVVVIVALTALGGGITNKISAVTAAL